MLDKTAEIVEEYAKEGLRTLYLGMKTISRNEYFEWSQKFKKAEEKVGDRE